MPRFLCSPVHVLILFRTYVSRQALHVSRVLCSTAPMSPRSLLPETTQSVYPTITELARNCGALWRINTFMLEHCKISLLLSLSRRHIVWCTVVPALGDPRRERPPAMYGHFVNVPYNGQCKHMPPNSVVISTRNRWRAPKLGTNSSLKFPCCRLVTNEQYVTSDHCSINIAGSVWRMLYHWLIC